MAEPALSLDQSLALQFEVPLAPTPRAKTPLRPPLKWAGGKRWLLPFLTPIWSPYRDRRLVEPLCGGLAVTLGLMPDRALLNDVNPHAINFYRWLKRGLDVPEELKFENTSTAYYSARDRFNRLIEAFDNSSTLAHVDQDERSSRLAAALFYYLNRTGYNGLCRFNKSGAFNVPMGRYKTITYRREFSDYREAFEGWDFECGDFQNLQVEPDDFLYLDPPYDVPFTQYTSGGFTWNDQVRLVEWASCHPGPVVLSNQATKRVVKLYDSYGFDLAFLNAPRMINCTGDRTPALEVLATRGINMTPRNTTTGAVLEQMILPALTRGGYSTAPQVQVGTRPGGGKHFVDVVATASDGEKFLVSLKWQQTSGTAEQKVPFEVMCLADSIKDSSNDYQTAYLVLGGDGWTLRDFYTSGGLSDHLAQADLVHIVTLERFIKLANTGKL